MTGHTDLHGIEISASTGRCPCGEWITMLDHFNGTVIDLLFVSEDGDVVSQCPNCGAWLTVRELVEA